MTLQGHPFTIQKMPKGNKKGNKFKKSTLGDSLECFHIKGFKPYNLLSDYLPKKYSSVTFNFSSNSNTSGGKLGISTSIISSSDNCLMCFTRARIELP